MHSERRCARAGRGMLVRAEIIAPDRSASRTHTVSGDQKYERLRQENLQQPVAIYELRVIIVRSTTVLSENLNIIVF